MDVTTNGDDRERVPSVARAIAKRRQDLDLSLEQFVEQTGLSRPGLAPLLAGIRKGYQERLTMPVCRVLKWTPDSIDRLFRGESPIERDDEPTRIGADTQLLLDKLAELATVIADLEAGARRVDRQVDALDARVTACEQEQLGNGPSGRRPRP